MKLWKLTRRDRAGYDEHLGFVVAARSEVDARHLADDKAEAWAFAQKGRHLWLSDIVECVAVGDARDYFHEPCIVLESFLHG